MKTPSILTASVAGLLSIPTLLQAADRIWVANPGTSVWSDASNWDANGVPVSGQGDNIYVHTPGSVLGEALDANFLFMAVGTAAEPTSGFTFGAGVYNLGVLYIGEGHIGNNHQPVGPINNRYGRAFINDGTTINVGSFHLGEWDGASGHVVQSGGAVNISNQFRLGHWPQVGGAQNSYTLNGGSVTVTGGPADPLSEGGAGNVILGVDSSGTLAINAGTFTAHGITMQTRGASGGESRLQMNGGVLNIGVNGIVTSNPGSLSSYDVQLKGGTIRATQNWSSNLEMSLIAGGTGINFDTNAKTIALSGSIIGGGSLTKVGTGTLKLTGANSSTGGLNVNAGRVQVGDGTASGGVGSGPIVITTPGDLTFNRTNALNVPGAVSGTGSVNVNSGTVRLANVSGTLSATVVAGATLGAAGKFGNVVANSGSTLEAGFGGTGNFTSDSLFLFGSTLRVSAGTVNSQFKVNNSGSFTAFGSNVIQVNPVGLTAGTYTLVDYAGTIGGSGFGSFSVTGLPGRATGSLVDNTANSSIDLNITSVDYPKWTGAVDDKWDTTTANWSLVIAGGPTTYQNLDGVLFDDSATGPTSVVLNSALTPSSVEFNNNGLTYTLTGTGSLTGTTGIVKRGAGRAIIATAGNDFTGPTEVREGTLQIGDGSRGSLGIGTAVDVKPAGTLELNLPTGQNYSTPTFGVGVVRTTGINNYNLGAGVLTGSNELNIGGDLLQVIGGNNQPSFAGFVSISSGTYRALGAQALGTTAGVTVITQNGALDLNGMDLGSEQVFVAGTGIFENGAIVNTGANTVFNLQRVTLTDNASFGGTSRWDIRTRGLPGELLDLGGHKLTKVGPNQVSLVEVNATDGDIDIDGGIFSVEAGAQVQGNGTITLNPGGTLGLWVNQPGRLTRKIVSNGGNILELGSGALATVDANLTMNASMTIGVNGGNTVLNYVGNIAESGGAFTLRKEGDGRLNLVGNNTVTGGFSVNGGVLQVGNGGTAGTLPTGTSNVFGVLRFAKTNETTLSGNINPDGPAGVLSLIADGAVTLAPGSNLKFGVLQTGINGQNDVLGGTLNVGPNTSLLVQDSVALGNTGGGGAVSHGIINQTGGVADINVPNTDGRNFVLGHWNQGQGTYNLSAGSLNAPNISMTLSWDGTGTFNLSGTGVASLLGLRFGNTYNNGTLGTVNVTGGTLNLGAEGIWAPILDRPTDINIGGGTVRATASLPITLPVEFTGENGDAIFDTNGNTITVTGALSGAGGLRKVGTGLLAIQGTASFAKLTTVAGRTDLTTTLGFGSSTIVANAQTNIAANQTLASLDIGAGGVVTLGELPAVAGPAFDAQAFGAGENSPLQAVPEPGSISLLFVSSLALLSRRFRRKTV